MVPDRLLRARSSPGLDEAVSTHFDECQGFDLLKATFTRHSFPRRFHETYVLELVDAGVDEFECRGETHRAESGWLVLINPGEVHTGRSAGARSLSYRSLYPRANLMTEIVNDLGQRGDCIPCFADVVVRDPELARHMSTMLCELEQPSSSLEVESCVYGFLARLLLRQGFACRTVRPGDRDHKALQRVRAHMRARQSQRISLAELAALTPWTSFHFLRMFCLAEGLPPHEYLLSLRIERAKKLLREAMPIAEVAQVTGFADQSHLTRCFKSRVGVPPGRFAGLRISRIKTRSRSLQAANFED
ncbi:MAG: AraC family transcriptional regulator [Planctomycetes bacterium]|nr:AraC family transcriptional regulator [Planctomycetota bacterium]